ncbi:hypothetical protein ACFL5G_02845 [Candidatus Margulisiibacteriota bacterium]
MAIKKCKECGKKLSFISFSALCKECSNKIEKEIEAAEEDIIKSKKVSNEQLKLLKKQKKKDMLRIYERVYEEFESDKELEANEIAVLKKIQEAFDLSKEEVEYNERILPYLYVNSIREKGELPEIDLTIKGGSQVILKKNEKAYFADGAALKEMRSVSLGYSGGSHGISFPIAKGVRYRVGAHRGRIVKEDRYVDTSQGILLITNKRLFLQPFPGNKPLSIPLDKILSYQAYKNGLELYKAGREKGYFFSMVNNSSVEILGLCLSHLLKQ